jgi:uncharacterized protein
VEIPVVAAAAGVIIGRTQLPLVNAGDALLHIAIVGRPKLVAAGVEAFQAELDPELDPNSDEPPIV